MIMRLLQCIIALGQLFRWVRALAKERQLEKDRQDIAKAIGFARDKKDTEEIEKWFNSDRTTE